MNKYSRERHKEQFWVEIIAYYFGQLIDVDVPKTFISIDQKNENGALSEWFYRNDNSAKKAFSSSNINYVDKYISGYQFMNAKIRGYDLEKGEQHNLYTLFEIMTEEKVGNWLELWIKYFVFDALIGNTDRHQDNWGILNRKKGKYLSPAFDNGTSMGYEILEENILKFNDENYLEKYINKGYHHIKLSQTDQTHVKHLQLIEELINRYNKKAIRIIREVLSFDNKNVEEILNYLVKFNTIIPLTEKRADFILRLIIKRKNMLMRLLK
ncbi:HipA domain-containing protein [bacterium]